MTISRRRFLGAATGGLAITHLASRDVLRTLPAAAPGQPGEPRFVDVADWRIEGRAFAERKAPYDRLPAAAEGVVRNPVWNLSRHSAGMAVRFASTSPELHVRYRLTSDQLAMPHMPATGVSGVDLYARDDAGDLRWVAVARPTRQDVSARLAGSLTPRKDGAPREFVLYLPLYNGVEKLELGHAEGTELSPLPAPAGRPVVVYGTSIAHGACASRPGMAWPAIVGRALSREVINLGFSGNGRMELEVGRFLCELDPAVFVVDCLPNMSPEQVAARTAPLVRQLRAAHATTPIVLVEDRTFGNAWIQQSRSDAHAQRRRSLRTAFAALRADGIENLHLIAGALLLGSDDEATTDGSHPNDLGMTRQAAHIVATLRPLLAN